MHQLQPNELFLINRNLVDSASAETNYVQAVIRDVNEAIIETVNLTDRGDQRFSKTWKVPSDNAYSTGKYITITTKVYTDAGYTTLSAVDGASSETYLIQARWSPLFGASGGGSNIGSGSGGGKIDEKLLEEIISKIIKGELKSIKPEVIKFPEIPRVDTERLAHDILKGVSEIVGGIPTPEKPERVDLSSLDSGIKKIAKELATRPKFEKTDLSGLASLVKKTCDVLMQMHEQNKKDMSAYLNKLIEEILLPLSDENAKLRVLNGLRNGSIDFQMMDGGDKRKKKDFLQGLKSRYGIN